MWLQAGRSGTSASCPSPGAGCCWPVRGWRPARAGPARMMDVMDVTSVTVGLPVSDLPRAVQWYQRVFDLGEPDLNPADGVLEFQVGPVWLQLSAAPATGSGAGPATRPEGGPVTRFGVGDAAAERARLSRLGIAAGSLEHVEGAVDYFGFPDPDGNQLSVYSLLS